MTPARVVLLVAVALYAACLPFQVFCIAGNCSAWPAWRLAAYGIIGVLLSDTGVAWFANPVLAVAGLAILFERRWLAIAASLGALVLALALLSFKTIVTKEGGPIEPITGYRLGYWLWIASMAITLVSALMLRPEQARQ